MPNGFRRQAVRLLLLFMSALAVVAVSAHPGHDDALTKIQAIAISKAAVRRLVANGDLIDGEALPESWLETDGYPRCEATPIYYLVSLDNFAEAKTLYVLLDHSGRFRRARFDKNFAELIFSSFPVFKCER